MAFTYRERDWLHQWKLNIKIDFLQSENALYISITKKHHFRSKHFWGFFACLFPFQCLYKHMKISPIPRAPYLGAGQPEVDSYDMGSEPTFTRRESPIILCSLIQKQHNWILFRANGSGWRWASTTCNKASGWQMMLMKLD